MFYLHFNQGDEKKEVKTGLKDYKKIEIIEGLDSTQFIYKPL